MSFKENLYEVVKNAIPKEVASHCNSEFEIFRKSWWSINGVPDTPEFKFAFADEQIKNSFSWYAYPCFEALIEYFLPQMQKVVDKELLPTYSYGRFYYHDAEMAIHTDRPSCEYSATVCIANDPNFGPWEIWFEKLNGEKVSIMLEEGDALVYKGTDLKHWRTPYKGQKQCQTFLHYVDKNGPYGDMLYDKRSCLGMPPVQ